MLLGLLSQSKKRLLCDDVQILNTSSQSVIKSVFLYEIGIEREQIAAIKLKQNIFGFLLLLAPGFEALNLTSWDGWIGSCLPWELETSSPTSAGQRLVDMGVSQEGTWALGFMLGAKGTSFSPQGEDRRNARALRSPSIARSAFQRSTRPRQHAALNQ